MPPGRSMDAASSRISACLLAHMRTFSGLQCSSASSSLRNIPSPEHGASTTMRSKKRGKRDASCCGVSLVTSALRTPIRSRFADRTFALSGWISFATRIPSPCRQAASFVLFPPGAAHRSRTRSPGCTPQSMAGAMALAS